LAKIASTLLWANRKNEVDKSRVNRAIQRLRGGGLIDRDNKLTAAGVKSLAEKEPV
jgi:predicted transcriptional regulator